jgi:hypothetical protein
MRAAPTSLLLDSLRYPKTHIAYEQRQNDMR